RAGRDAGLAGHVRGCRPSGDPARHAGPAAGSARGGLGSTTANINVKNSTPSSRSPSTRARPRFDGVDHAAHAAAIVRYDPHLGRRLTMARAYDVIDADGHVLEPVDIWDKYMDPAYRERAPQMIVDTDGKERLLVEGRVLGSPKGLGLLGAIGARQGNVDDVTMKYVEGRRGGFDPHARIPDMDLDGIDAAFLYPSIGLFSGAVTEPGLAAAMCRAYNRWLADYCSPYPDRLFGLAML